MFGFRNSKVNNNFNSELDVSVIISDISEVPAGGRSSVQTVTIKNGPVEPLTFNFFILDNQPSFSDVWPRSITL